MQHDSAGADSTGQVAPAFVGREHEIAAVTAALSHGPAVVLIDGEAGIGKTALVRQCLATEAMSGLRVVTAVCPPLAEPFPLGPLVDALHRLPVDELELSPLAGALRPLFPEWTAELPPAPEPLDDPRATRHRLFRAMAELVGRSGADMVVVEDAHWADAATIEMLTMLATSIGGGPSLVITYRGTDVPPGSPLLLLTSRSPVRSRPLRLTLEPLTIDETTRMVASIFATDEVSTEFATFLHRHTEGVPLALEECVSLLRDRGDIVRRGGEWSRRALDELQVPPTVRDSVLERVQRLDPVARRVLEAAAVLFEPADEACLAHVAALGDSDLHAGLAAALTSALVRETEPGRFMCRHALTAKAVEEAMPVSARRRLHQRAAELLQQLSSPPLARLSRHFREAGDVEQWSRYAEDTAELALASGADRAAVVVLLDLLDSAEHPPQRRARLARKLGEAATWGVAVLGELANSVTAMLGTVLDADDLPPGERGELGLLLGRLLLQLGDFDGGADRIETAAADLRDRPSLAARAMISLAYPRGTAWPVSRHLEWLAHAVDLFPEVSAADRAWLAVDRASVLLMMGDEAGWAAADDVVATGTTLSEQRQVARCLLNAGHAAIAWGRDDEARRHLDAAVDLFGSTGYQRLMNSALITRAHLQWHGGQWAGLADWLDELAGSEDTLPEAHLEARFIRAFLDLAAGRRADAEAALTAVLAHAEQSGLVDIQTAPAAAIGRLRLADDAVADAAEVTGGVVDTLRRKGMWVWGAEPVPVHVEALVRGGRVDEAAELVDRFAAGLDGVDAPGPRAAWQVSAAIVAEARGRRHAAADEFAHAARAWSELPRPYAELLAVERQGRALLGADRAGEALPILTTVQERLHDLGARWDADRVAHLLRRHGVEVSRTWRGGRRGYGDRLSPREQEVAAFVARGLTNRQTAEALFLSTRTVDRHLSAAMRKLGVTSRTALAVALTDAQGST